jgi:hypothetical protein
MAELKKWPRPHSLPKVPFAIQSLPKDFFVFSERSKPYLPVKSVLAAVFMWQCGRLMWR